MDTTYQVGSLIGLDDADPELPYERDAVKLALAESSRVENGVFGVWTGQMHGSELLYIAYMGELFRKA